MSTTDTAMAVLTALLGLTESLWSACARDEAGVEDVVAAMAERRLLLARLDLGHTFTPAERELAERLRLVDEQLLAWCDRQQCELAQALANLPRRSADATASTQRLLSDFA